MECARPTAASDETEPRSRHRQQALRVFLESEDTVNLRQRGERLNRVMFNVDFLPPIPIKV